MLAREVDKPFSDKDWIYEMKYDGFRAIAEVKGKKVRLYSRNGNSFNEAYPAIVKELSRLGLNAVLDGEVIALDKDGRSSFQTLQLYKSDGSPPLEFRVFDLLYLNGKNICSWPLIRRKETLKKMLPKNPVVKYSSHISGEGESFFEAAKEKDLEGIIAKEAASEYYPGARTGTWLKIKNHKSAEAVIAGFTAPGGSRRHFGSLILGAYDGGSLRYIGHTGSGFNEKLLRELHTKLSQIVIAGSPFPERVKTNSPATWVKPKLVAEIKYSEWTREGMLRHPIFLRLRNDKKPGEVTIRTNRPLEARAARQTAEKEVKMKTAARKKQTTKKNAATPATASGKKEEFLKVGSHKVRVTNLQKVFWPDEGITKGDVIRYYQDVSRYILPYLKNRAESLKRNPNGIRDFGFFHKDAGEEAPSFVKSEPIYSEGARKTIDYIVCNNQATLTYMNNLGCIEINPWHSTVSRQDHPDYLIMDIDPSEKNSFDQVVETALVIRDILKGAGTESYCKTSGSSGLHVYVPCGKKYDYDQVKDFAHLIAMLTVDRLPKFTTLERNLKKRGNKRIYVDFLQNRKGQTISSVYSLRPKPGAPVSMPLHWKEVKPGLSPLDFNIHNALRRIKKTGDIFSGVLGKGFDLGKALKNLDR